MNNKNAYFNKITINKISQRYGQPLGKIIIIIMIESNVI